MLEKEHIHQEENKLTFNIRYYPEFQNMKQLWKNYRFYLC